MTEAVISNKEPVNYNTGEIDKDELSLYIFNNIKTLINFRNEPQPYYGFQSLTQKWEEYDRCYLVRAKEDRAEYEYQGFSNIVTPDFFKSIDIKVSKEMKSLFNGAQLFTTKAKKYSKEQDAILARKLVEYNFDRVEKFQTEIRKLARDRRVYGTWFAYCPWTIKEQVIDNVISENENENGEIVTPIKYTDIQQISVKRVFINPNIEDIQNQEIIAIQITYSYGELLQMEEDGLIDKDMADYVKNRYRPLTGDTDLDSDETDGTREEGMTVTNRNLLSYRLWLCYYRRGTGKDRKTYEALYMWNDKILGAREYIKDAYPIKRGVYHPISCFAYGLGQGDIIYPTYISKCARINQVFDRETFEILGGGMKDAQALPDFSKRRPGVFEKVNGLQASLAQGGKPVMTWMEVDGSRPASSALEIVPFLDKMMDSGSGSTETLAGMPTNSQADRTAAGMTLIADQAEDRIGSELALFEDECLKGFAEECYDNYHRFLIPDEDLPNMFDDEELTYFDGMGQKQTIKFGKLLRDVDFVFTSAQRVIDREEKIGKTTKFLLFLKELAMTIPSLGQLIAEKTNFEFLIKNYADALDITDLDRLFPKFNSIGELLKCRAALQQASQQNQMMGMGIQEVMQKLGEMKDEAALGVIEETMQKAQMVMKQMQEQGGAPNAQQ